MRRFAGLSGFLLFALTLSALTSPLQAQAPPTYELDGLVVTGTSIPRARSEMGSNVSVLSGDDLRVRGVTRVLDALQDVPGLSVVEGGSFGSVASVFLRGGESDYVLVLVDGVQVNQPGGSFDFSSLTTEGVDRIEVVRGPASALYGSDAMAGVIHVITKSGSGGPRGSVGFRTGSFGRRDWTGDVSGGTAAASYGFTLLNSQSDGILAFNNQFENTVFTGAVQLTPDDVTSVRLTSRLGRREFHFPTDGTGNLVDQNAYTFGDEASVSVDMSRPLSDRLDLRATVGTYTFDGGSDDRADGPADTLGFYSSTSLDALRRTSADVRSNVRLGGATVSTLGLEFESQAQRSFSEYLSEFGPSGGNSRNERWNRAAYGHVVSAVGRLSLNGGLRVEDNERFGRFVTWQAGMALSYHVFGRVRAAAGKAIKEPTFFETYSTGFSTGNPELDPERASSWEVGIEQGFLDGAVRVDATYFDQSFVDLIQYTFAPPGPTDPNYFNIAEATSRGVELSTSVQAAGFAGSVDVSWLDTNVIDSGFDEGVGATFVEGEALLRRPSLTWGASAGYALPGRLNATAALRHVGDRSDRDFSAFPSEPVVLSGYTLLSVGGEIRLSGPAGGRPGIDLTVRGENLLDEGHQEVFGFAAPGRSLYVGARITVGR